MKNYVNQVPTPGFVVEEELLLKNLEILKYVKDQSGCKILLAQKAFSMFSMYPMISAYLDGTTASGLFEARLGYEEFGGETHVFSPAYREDEIEEIMKCCNHMVFNSLSQWKKYGPRAIKAGISCGIRLNPECSTQDGHEIYDPCGAFSRLGIVEEGFRIEDYMGIENSHDGKELQRLENLSETENSQGIEGPQGIEGFHMHTLCEQNADALIQTLEALESKFGKYLYDLKWLNLGGGHHITRVDYDVKALIECIKRLKATYDIEVYLEPGEAVVLNTGFLVTTVLDKTHNGMDILLLDTSAACHMPDVLEMPYRPNIIDAGNPGEKAYTYRLGGPTCLAGDVIGDYSFDTPINPGDRLVFCDMALYTMVKTNTFNGMRLPSISIYHKDEVLEVVKEFGYEDFKTRLS